MTRLSDAQMCRGRELLGEDTQIAREAKDDLTQERRLCRREQQSCDIESYVYINSIN